MSNEVTHEEVQFLKEQVVAGNAKIDLLTASVNLVHNMLAEQKGANLPSRIEKLEERVDSIKEQQDQRALLPAVVDGHTNDIKDLRKFQYTVGGITLIFNFVGAIAVKFILDYWFKAAPVIQQVVPAQLIGQ